MFALTGTGCATKEPLLGFICSSSPDVIKVADIFRSGCLLLGVVITGLYAYYAIDRRAKLLTGLVFRLVGATLAAYYIAVTELDRMGDPVTLRLPLGIAALVCLTIGAAKFRQPVTADDDIDARIERLDRAGRTPPT